MEDEALTIRAIADEDYEKVESLIKRCIVEVNAKDYPPAVIEYILTIDPYRPREKKDERDYFVAGAPEISGIIGVKENEIKTFFVDPLQQGAGIGSSLLAYAENVIRGRGYTSANLYSSTSAKTFYEKHGYRTQREDRSSVGTEIMLRYYMEKELV